MMVDTEVVETMVESRLVGAFAKERSKDEV